MGLAKVRKGNPRDDNMANAWKYAREFMSPESVANFELLAKYRPEVFESYIALRQAAYNEGARGALPLKVKELIVLAIEITRLKTSPPPVNHAKQAVDAGATPAEIAEVISLCVLLGGMVTWAESGRHVLQAAEERHRELRHAKATGSRRRPAQ
jgi:alkylhydroperoxidase/carboxymuconolactone decarboxylase family protein YurZ